MARPTKAKYDEDGIDERVDEMRCSLSKEIDGLPLVFLERNLREAATLEAMMDGCKEVVQKDGMTRQESTGAANNKRIKVVPNANLDVYLKLLRTYQQVTATITKLTKSASEVAEEEVDELDAFLRE